MGYLSALDMAGQTDLDTALGWHLSANHYPPIPAEMIEPAKAALEAFRESDIEREIELPDVVTYKDGRTTAPAWALVEHLHLEAFLDAEEEEEWIDAMTGEVAE